MRGINNFVVSSSNPNQASYVLIFADLFFFKIGKKLGILLYLFSYCNHQLNISWSCNKVQQVWWCRNLVHYIPTQWFLSCLLFLSPCGCYRRFGCRHWWKPDYKKFQVWGSLWIVDKPERLDSSEILCGGEGGNFKKATFLISNGSNWWFI